MALGEGEKRNKTSREEKKSWNANDLMQPEVELEVVKFDLKIQARGRNH